VRGVAVYGAETLSSDNILAVIVLPAAAATQV